MPPLTHRRKGEAQVLRRGGCELVSLLSDAFITDFGRSLSGRDADGSILEVKRYAVWSYCAQKAAHQIVDCGNNLSELRDRYGTVDVVRLWWEPGLSDKSTMPHL